MIRKISELLEMFENFPAGDIGALLEGRRALILAPHPDDESLGCGGLIAAACAAGIPPVVVILTDGSASHPGSLVFPPSRLGELRELEAARATWVLGLPPSNLYFLRQRDAKLPSTGDDIEILVQRVGGIGKAHGCEVLVGPWSGDPHCDHEAGAAIAARVAAQRGWKLLSYPVWGWLRAAEELCDEPRCAGWRLSIAAHANAKNRAIAEHASQYGDLIKDSPRGFRLPKNLLAVFSRPFEVFITSSR